MLSEWKRRRKEKKELVRAVAGAEYWKTHPLLGACIGSMRGSCTVAPMQMHEAVVAAVNIALRENCWTEWKDRSGLSKLFSEEPVYLLWDDESLPALMTPWASAVENLTTVLAVARQTFLVSQTMDRIIWFDMDGRVKSYVIA